MANFGQLILTLRGLQEQVKAQSGGELKFKRIALGSGAFNGNINTLTKLVTEKVSVAISEGYIQNDAYTVEGFFSNEALQTGFEWREIGVYIEDAGGNEILYCYANAGNAYDYIPATEDERYSKHIRIAMVVGNTTNVSIVESEGIVYVDTQTFKSHRDNTENPHGVTAAQAGAVPKERKVNNKELTSDINLTADDVKAVKSEAEILSTTSITEVALAQANGTIKHYAFSGDSYTGNDLPSEAFKYGSATVFKRYGFATIVLWGAPNSNYIATKYFNTTHNTWSDWAIHYSTGNKPTPSDIDGVIPVSKGGTGKGNAADGFTVLARRDSVGNSNLVNADTLTTPGIHQVYFEGSTYNPSDYNYPYAYGVLFVASTVSYVGQLFYAVSANKLWYRTRATTSSNWGSWCRVYDTNNKPTLEELGAAEASTHNIKTYTNLSQLGLSNGATMLQVAKALPGSSMLRIYVLTSENSNLAPTATNGWLEVSRPATNHVEFRYTTTSRMVYYAVVLNVNNTNEQVSEWTKMATADDLAGLPVAGHKHTKSEITDFPTSMTPTSHASSATTYGVGNASNYGHLKLSDVTNGTSGVGGGVAATPAAVKAVNDKVEALKTETWTFTLEDGSTVTKAVYVG